MSEYLKTILTRQIEASLCMLKECVQRCPEEHWDGKVGSRTFRQIAFHTLFYVDLYLSPSKEAFQRSERQRRGVDGRGRRLTSLTREETLDYLALCRRKAVETLVRETPETLQGFSGFSRLGFSRGELHLYNLRHVQHHTGQLSAYLRAAGKEGNGWWIKSGWRGSKQKPRRPARASNTS